MDSLLLFLEYKIKLENGEVVEIAEVKNSRISKFLSHGDDTIIPIVNRCSYASREVVEEAKYGYAGRFQRRLKTPPYGVLMKLDETCRLIHSCAMADEKACSTKNTTKKKGKFPECWEFNVSPGGVQLPFLDDAGDLATQIVHFWRQGKYVIIVEND